MLIATPEQTTTTSIDHHPPGTCHEGTLLHFEGGHKTVIRRPITDVVKDLCLAREEGIDFVFLDSPGHGLNGFVVDPSKVVALIATISHR
jgi:hypothetical protein